MSKEAYKQVKEYSDDLSERIRLLKEWNERHSDSDSPQFKQDWKDWYYDQEGKHDFKSSFDPNDPSPDTADVLTAETFNNIMLIALAAYEKAINHG